MSEIVQGLDELITALLASEEVIAKVTMHALSGLGEQTKGFAQDELEDVRYTGALGSSFVVDLDRAKLQAQIYPTADHAMSVRMGTRPHWMPIAPLKDWAAAKLGDERLAYPVQWGIAREGTSVYQERKRGTKANPWPERVVTSGAFLAALAATARRIGTDIETEILP
jgi:hypothetical protein